MSSRCTDCGSRVAQEGSACPRCGAPTGQTLVIIDLDGSEEAQRRGIGLDWRFWAVALLIGIAWLVAYPGRSFLYHRSESALGTTWAAAQSLDEQRFALATDLTPVASAGNALGSDNPPLYFEDLGRLAAAEKVQVGQLLAQLPRAWPFDGLDRRLRTDLASTLRGRVAYLGALRAYYDRLGDHPDTTAPAISAATGRAQLALIDLIASNHLGSTRAPSSAHLHFSATVLARSVSLDYQLLTMGVLPPEQIDLASGRIDSLTGVGFGAYPYQLTSLVQVGSQVLGTTPNDQVVAFSPGSAPQFRVVGDGSEVFAADRPAEVWLYQAGLTGLLVGKTIAGATLQTLALPPGSSPLALTTYGWLLQSGAGTGSTSQGIGLWDPETGLQTDLGSLGQFVAADSDHAAWTSPQGDLVIAALGTKQIRTLSPPPGTDGYLAGGGSISPDGQLLAAFMELGPASSVLGTAEGGIDQLVLVDLNDDVVTRIPGTEVVISSSAGATCWDPGGRWVFISGSFGSLDAVGIGGHGLVVDTQFPPNNQCLVYADGGQHR